MRNGHVCITRSNILKGSAQETQCVAGSGAKITSKTLKKNSLGQNNGTYVLGQVYSENCRTIDECREDPQEIPPLADEDWHAVC